MSYESFFRSGMRVAIVVFFWNLIAFSGHAQTVLFANNFESGSSPGWFRTTSGDNTFHGEWSISSSIGAEPGNHYADFLANVPVLPTSPSVRWWGGYGPLVQSSLTLPSAWEVSFDIRRDVIEPVLVKVLLATSFPNPSVVYTAWATPTSTAWSHVTLESSQFTRSTEIVGGTGTYLQIAMSSHDAAGHPLQMDSIGTFEMQLDNVTFLAVPEPGVATMMLLMGALAAWRSRWQRKPRAARSDA